MPSSPSNSDLNGVAHGNVETVWLPVEVALEGPEEVVEIRDVVVDLVGDVLQILEGEDRGVQIVGQLLGEVDRLAQRRHGVRLDLGLLVGVGVLLLVERQLLTAAAALRGEQVGERGVVERPAQGSGDALHHRDAGNAE